MLGRTFLLRFFAAWLAAIQALAPGVASIVDARLTAQTERAQLAAHIDAPGTKHPISHPDRCALCGIASRIAEALHVPALLPPVVTTSEGFRNVRVARREGVWRWSPPSRAPPRV